MVAAAMSDAMGSALSEKLRESSSASASSGTAAAATDPTVTVSEIKLASPAPITPTGLVLLPSAKAFSADWPGGKFVRPMTRW